MTVSNLNVINRKISGHGHCRSLSDRRDGWNGGYGQVVDVGVTPFVVKRYTDLTRPLSVG